HHTLLEKDIEIDVVTDQTSAHDPLNGYIPKGYTIAEANGLRKSNPGLYQTLSKKSMATIVEQSLVYQQTDPFVFANGDNIRQVAKLEGAEHAFDFPGFVPACIRPLFCEGKGSFRWVALSGDPEDIYRTDQLIKDLFPENEALT